MKLPQLSLRELFWIVLIAALICGWWMEHIAAQRNLDNLRKASEEAEALRRQNKNLLTALGGADAMLQEAADDLYPVRSSEPKGE